MFIFTFELLWTAVRFSSICFSHIFLGLRINWIWLRADLSEFLSNDVRLCYCDDDNVSISPSYINTSKIMLSWLEQSTTTSMWRAGHEVVWLKLKTLKCLLRFTTRPCTKKNRFMIFFISYSGSPWFLNFDLSIFQKWAIKKLIENRSQLGRSSR